ncbi:FAD-dependent oxidoreductase [Yinghuangia sp. ASG 101]|uniref:NAD(P)/FAD-dependent oxidoreductase n=1 Tax=Yinghuangia sp. ASG 101 TaxID=2896848 RepID=UPI001E2F4E54|nr:FAD-dependent oxidoreductase [Yinghuangia sp. ASG 101]UGQ12968.1 FAD-dependent oxidoreductase [Yinghuangia sp. ASG 101]
MEKPVFAIVGASLAGGRAAEALRAGGFDGRVVLVGAEEHAPYERPPLSKRFLTGQATAADLLLRPSWDDLDVELVTGERVVAVSAADRSVELESGRRFAADKVLLATGGRNRPLPVEGTDLAGVFRLRDIGHATALGPALAAAENVVVVGAGFIGLEVAATAHTLGCRVTVVEAASVPLARGLGPTWGAFVAEQHIDRGVRVGAGVGVRAILGRARVRGVELADGTVLPADCVVVGVGLEPRTELARGLGLAVDDGIVVDASARTSNPAVFAAGDATVQPAWWQDGRVRLESYQNAREQAEVAAAAMLGLPVPTRRPPWFWSDQFDMNIQVAGSLSRFDQVAFRGDAGARRFAAFHLTRGRVTGVLAVNRGRDVRAGMELIEYAVPVGAAELEDESVDLRRLARAVARSV